LKKLKIAYILTPVEFAGAERVNLTFLKNVNRDKFDIHPLLLIRPWEKDDNIFINELRREEYVFDEIPVAKNEGRDYFRITRCFKIVYSLFKKNHYDLIHTHGYFADIVGIPMARFFRLPSIATCHGFIFNSWKYRFYNNLDFLALRLSDRVMAVSEDIKTYLVKHGVNRSRISMIQNAVESCYTDESAIENRAEKRRLLNIKENEMLLGFTGRLSKEKGLRYLIEACFLLNQVGLPTKVLIIGEGPQRKELVALADSKDLGHKVLFVGFQKDVHNWLPAVDAFILPSITEGTPMSLLEAMSWGLPIVASDVGGIPQIIDSEKNGVLVPPRQPDRIKEAVYRLYTNGDFRKNIGFEARKTVETKYGIRTWLDKIESEYLDAIGHGHRRSSK